MSNCNKYPSYPAILDDDVILASEKKLTHEKDFKKAKLILQQCSSDTGNSLYDHLSEIIKHAIDERPENVTDYFEEYSRSIREKHFSMNENILENIYIEPKRLETAQNTLRMLHVEPEEYPGASIEFDQSEEETEGVEEIRSKTKSDFDDVMFQQFFWNFAGFGFPQNETFLLACALRKLYKNKIIASCKFWGKMTGTLKNYYIAEVELTEIEISKRLSEQDMMFEKNFTFENEEENVFEHGTNPNSEIDMTTHQNSFNLIDDVNLIKAKDKIYPDHDLDLFPRDRPIGYNDSVISTIIPRPKVGLLPKSGYQPPPMIPSEKLGEGINRFVYFVCTELTGDWIELPVVTPQQIIVSRQITKFLTGDLEYKIVSYPNFPGGTEKYYLRALIGRISSGTHISPVGYYTTQLNSNLYALEEEDEEEEDEEDLLDNDKPIYKNTLFRPLDVNELMNIKSWVHHKPNILKQGRVKWVDINKSENEENVEEDEAEEEDGEEGDEVNVADDPAEFGPLLFTSCAEDRTNQYIPAWTIRRTSVYNHSHSMVVVRSNIWPGSVTFATEKFVSNLYVGFGNKYIIRNYSPPDIPQIKGEYLTGPEIVEISDPTVEEEKQWEIDHEIKALLDEEEEEEEEELDDEEELPEEDEE